MNLTKLDRDKVIINSDELIKEYENEIYIEKLAGNVVKEAMAKGIVMGIKMVSQNSRLTIEVDEEELAIFCHKIAVECGGYSPKNWEVVHDEDKSAFKRDAKSLKSSMDKWAKIGIEKENK